VRLRVSFEHSTRQGFGRGNSSRFVDRCPCCWKLEGDRDATLAWPNGRRPAESSPGQRRANHMAVIVAPTPVDGPSHMPFGAHRTPFAVAGVGPDWGVHRQAMVLRALFGACAVLAPGKGISGHCDGGRRQGARRRSTSVGGRWTSGRKPRPDSTYWHVSGNSLRARRASALLRKWRKNRTRSHQATQTSLGPDLSGNRRDRGACR
jgi:hypothetical protein